MMNRLTIAIALILLYSCSNNRTDYKQIASFQDNTIPELQVKVTDTTKVLVIMPHADDETIAAGLIALLKDEGARIHLLALCALDQERSLELSCSASILGIEKIETAGFINNTWDAIMQDKITFWYDQKDSIKTVIKNKIDFFAPDILITYDDEIGGYGHPEHRISAELTRAIFLENLENPDFKPETIFQITLSKGLESFLVSESPGYNLSKKLTGNPGLPEPDVALDIRRYWKIKNAAARCHKSQEDILRKFYIIYEEKDEQDHINAFCKEYYRVIAR